MLAPRFRLTLRPEQVACLIVVLLWLRWFSHDLLNSLLGDKHFVNIGESAPVDARAELAGRIVLLVLLGVCSATVVLRIREIPRVGLLRLAVFLAPWLYMVIRDAYNGLLSAQALPVGLLVLAIAALRPGGATLRCLGVVTMITAATCLVLGLVMPSAGILREESGMIRDASKAIFPSLGLLQGVFTSENSMAESLVLGLPAILLLRGRVKWLGVALVTAAVVWSSSRGGLLGLAAVLSVAALAHLLRGHGRRRLLSASLTVVALGAAAVMVTLPLLPWPASAFTTRGAIWRASLESWFSHGSLFGLGSDWYDRVATTAGTPFGANGGAYHGHNEFVQIGVTGGVLLVFVVGLWLTTVAVVSLQPREPLMVTTALVLVGILVEGFFEVPLGFVDRAPTWLVTIVPLAVAFFTADVTSSEHLERRRPFTAQEQRQVTTLLAGLAVVSVAVLGLGVAGTGSVLTTSGRFRQPSPVVVPSQPFTTRALYVDPAAQVVRAARTDPDFLPLAQTPQAKWFTDWSSSRSAQQDFGTYLAGADARNALPVAVLYRIPQRDCGAYASGGAASGGEYRAWIDRAARALRGHQAIVIVEPDALAQSRRCGGEDRVQLLRYATDTLAAAGAWVYLDAGHAGWVDPDEMARRLVEAGIVRARGFTLNVANHDPTGDEIVYGNRIEAELAALGVADRHFIVDTGRNGAAVQGGAHCNAAGARLGRKPSLTFDGALDGYLWVKNPGESDGRCRGGPASGFWDQAALMLLGHPSTLAR